MPATLGPRVQVRHEMDIFSNTLKPSKIIRRIAELHPGMHQAPNYTSLDRYPSIFARTAEVRPDARRVLSFGCSTGEECVTLKKYFPSAAVVGADINPLNLISAYRRFWSNGVRFIYASDRHLRQAAPFDVIFCMAVLRVPRDIQARGQLAREYPFELYNGRVDLLDLLLSVNGLLVIHKAIYRFCDSRVASKYLPIEVTYPIESDDRYYRPDGTFLEAGYSDVIFKKIRE